MKALVKSHAERGLWLENVPEPEPGINDVKIRVLCTGICGTDLHIYDWNEWAQSVIHVPLVIGHEFCGEIVEVGSNVEDLHPGDLVSGEGHVVCGRCRNCLAGRRHLCAHTQGVGVNRAGAFAEFVVLPMMNVWKHTRPIALEIAAIFDPFGNAVHTALSFPVLGEDVLVTGAGPIGIMAAVVARFAGARHVAITDVNPHRLKLAEKAGIPVTVDSRTTRCETFKNASICVKDSTLDLRCRARRKRSAKCWTTCATAARSPCSGFRPVMSRSIGATLSSTCLRSKVSTAVKCLRPGTR